jgi:peptidoglycan/LPS O-acetylase OafA/YrhL
VLQGQLPHRDFTDVYTGALSMLHALALRVFGMNFMATRWMLPVAVACWVPILHWLARRLARPVVTGLVVLVGIVPLALIPPPRPADRWRHPVIRAAIRVAAWIGTCSYAIYLWHHAVSHGRARYCSRSLDGRRAPGPPWRYTSSARSVLVWS